MKVFNKALKDNKIKQSMSRKGNCLDNALMESFWDAQVWDDLYDEA